MKVLVDNQLPPALARMLESLGVDAQHVRDVGLQTATDDQVWSAAADGNQVLITKDQDFLHRALSAASTQIVWVRLGNCRRKHLLAVFRTLWSQIQERIESGEIIIEVR